MCELSPPVDQYLNVLAVRVADSLGDNLVGTYLHGSAVLGGFNLGRSDADVLVVVQRGLSEEDRGRLRSELNAQALPVPVATLEMSVITLETARHPTGTPHYEMHINTLNERFANGEDRTDPDLVLHFPVVRQSGRVIGDGPSPQQVFAPVPRPLVLAAMAKEIGDALRSPEATPEYLLLNACRNLAYMREGRLVSKVDGGQWVLDHAPEIDPGLVRAAIDRQMGRDSTAAMDAVAVRETGIRIAADLSHAAGR